MSLTSDLFTYITADSGVSALIGTKLFDLYVPENTSFPYCTLIREQLGIEDYLSGKTALRQSQYSISIVSDTAISGEAVEEALITLLASTRGAIGTSLVRVVYYNGSSDTFLAPVDGSEESIHVIEMSFEVHWLKT